MAAIFRTIVLNWLLKRLGAGWLFSLVSGAALVLLIVIGIPALAGLAAAGFGLWRLTRRPAAEPVG